MICSSSSPPIRRRPGEGRAPRGFTLVELLVVLLILAILIALLLPAINAALRTAKNAAVGGEMNQLAQALNAFKAKYGDYPPSRIMLAENGDYSGVSSTATLSITGISQDINLGQLTQRSVAALRKFFPSVNFSTGGALFNANSGQWYDFNGNGVLDGHYILQGHQCLAFFLGGIPQVTSTGYGMSGFAKNPSNPFVNVNVTTNREPPFFEFDSSRLALDPSNPYSAGGFADSQIPGYLDSLGNETVSPSAVAGAANSPVTGFYMSTGAQMINFYAYFSSYGNGGYDPNDVNFNESDQFNNANIGLTYHVTFPVPGATYANSSSSPAPNPYTSALTAVFTGNGTPRATTFLNPQTFQIISSGLDGLYGVGGQYLPNNTTESLSLDTSTNPAGHTPYINTTDTGIRIRERDNVTNFHNGKLE